MRCVVITGSTRGIGRGLAEAFLASGCAVTISGRTQESVAEALTPLAEAYGPERVLGHPCDVTDFAAVQGLWDAAQARFGKVDIWINNAGVGHPQIDFWDCDPAQIEAVVATNVIGAMYGARVALAGMLAQGFGALYNMEGLGSDGRRVAGLTLYGSTKCGLRYLTQALVAEVRGTPVIVGALSPGMVVTDLLTRQYEDRSEDWERARRIFNILADRVETVTPWLARRVLANETSGARIEWLTRGKVWGRFLLAPFRKRDVFEDRR